MSLAPQPERPDIDAGYGIGDPQYPFTPIEWDDVVRRLTESRNYWIATTRASGRAHSVPVWGVWVNDTFWFFTGPKSLTGSNLARNGTAEVHLESGDDVVLLFGEFETVTAPETVASAYQAKYGMSGDGSETAYRLRLSKAIAWREHDFPSSATRWRF
ncbi:MAG: pyridoxamine 5'-phosphate oxidase family protein [Chloroflexota bacterium]|nr:pyridoxamine 5'-phosphate oxidase family protein [Chloroflexota bacterium]MDE2891096.1 pyridoxamine 5'-phosphate oxidase family protein [Chloroflexota bacterium]